MASCHDLTHLVEYCFIQFLVICVFSLEKFGSIISFKWVLCFFITMREGFFIYFVLWLPHRIGIDPLSLIWLDSKADSNHILCFEYIMPRMHVLDT